MSDRFGLGWKSNAISASQPKSRLGCVTATTSIRAAPSKIGDLPALRFVGRVWPPGASYTGEGEEHRIIEELTSFLVQAAALEAQEITNGSGRRVGRPRDVMTPYLAPELLSVYLRCHNSGGRQSVATSTDGKLGQKEAGLLFEFIKATIEPLNRYLTTELHRRPLSASRLARFALGERLRVVRVAKRQKIVALEKRRLRLGGLNP
jgi:hypothetical protein